MKRIFKKQDGYILAWVICIFLFFSILSVAAVTVSLSASRTTLVQHEEQQVYYTAKSVSLSVAKYINDNASNADVIDSILNNQGTGTKENMGSYTVDVTKVNEAKLKIVTTATYRNETYSLSTYLIKPPAPSGIIPTDNVIYLNEPTGNGFGQCKLIGSVYVDGDLNLGQGSKIDGFVVVKGNSTFTGAGYLTSGLFSYGNVNLLNGAGVNGDLLSKGDIKIDGSGTIEGFLTADGSLNMLNGNIKKDALIGNNAHFAGGAKINGSLKYGGNITCAWGGPSSFVMMGATKVTDYTPIDDAPYRSQSLPIIEPPLDKPKLNNEVVITDNIISSSGTITPSVVAQLNQKPWATTITIDATQEDVHLLLKNTALDIKNGMHILVKSDGVHNVYLYMAGTSSISVNANCFFGMETNGNSPRLFIIGNGNQSISLNNNSEMDACVYIPQGSFSASGSQLEVYKFVGSCIVKDVNISNNVVFHYSGPDIEDTPLDIFIDEGSEEQNRSWVIESWGRT
ncbi:MAG: hypothetical protein PHH84_05600 [Oscillospiraceae bacterium]|nr:hypothetical protein [Oscillospiraceae bacterium]MDD4414245.1 hypothetical protein [Oscillospiraceae bacterium]